MNLRTFVRTVALVASLIMISNATAIAWDVTINGRPASDGDSAMSVAVDPQTGNIFVAGNRQGSSTSTQFFVAKFTSAGQQEWQEVVEGSSAAKVAIDLNGFVFVGGSIVNSDSGPGIVIMKIDGRSSSKDVLWTRVIDVFGFDEAVNSIALTPDGGVAIAGMVGVGSGAYDFYLMKFTGDGTDAWPSPQILSGTASNGLNVATAVGILPNGDVAVTGWVTNNVTNADFVVGRFDGATGARDWLVTLASNGVDVGTSLSVALNGDIVAGGITRFAGSDFAVFRFSGSGVLLWRTLIDLGFFNAVRTVAVAPSGDVIAGGTLEPTSGPNNSEFVVVSLDAGGQERWRYENAGPFSANEVRGLAFDRNGNPVATGISQDSSDALSTFTVVALNKDTGTVLWNVPIVGSAPFENDGQAIASDPTTGAMIAVGRTQNERTSFDMTVTSITEGSENWRRNISGPGKRVDRDDAVLALAVDPHRNSIALAGYAQNTGATSFGVPREFRVVKVRKNGTIAWKYDLTDHLPHLNNVALAVAVDVSGDFFAAGRTCSVSFASCFTVVRVDKKHGKEVWRTVVPGTGVARAIIQDPQDGNLIVAGSMRIPTGSVFSVFKLDANTGTVLWPASLEDSPLGTVNALTLTSRGTVAAAGVVEGSFAVLELDASTGTIVSRGILAGSGEARSVAFDSLEGTVVAVGSMHLAPPFSSLMTIAKFDSNGTALWSEQVGNERFENSGISVAVHQESEAIVVGGTLSDPAGRGFTALVLGPDGSERWRSDGISGFTNSVVFAANSVVAVGEIVVDNSPEFAVIAFTEDGTEQWRRTFRGSAAFASNSAVAAAVDEKKKAVFVAGVVTNNSTGPDMFAVGLGIDGSDLPGVPGAPSLATPLTRRAMMKSLENSLRQGR